MHLDAFELTDSNGDNIHFLLFHYLKAGSDHKPIKLGTENVVRHLDHRPRSNKGRNSLSRERKRSLLY